MYGLVLLYSEPLSFALQIIFFVLIDSFPVLNASVTGLVSELVTSVL